MRQCGSQHSDTCGSERLLHVLILHEFDVSILASQQEDGLINVELLRQNSCKQANHFQMQFIDRAEAFAPQWQYQEPA